MRFLTSFIVIGLFLATKTSGQEKEIRLDLDYSIYRFDDTLNLMEVYYSFYQGDLTLEKKNGTTNIGAVLMFEFNEKANGRVVIKKEYKIDLPVDTSEGKALKSFVGVLKYLLPFNKYTAKAYIYDFYKKDNADTIIFEVENKKFPTTQYAISEIELASNIRKGEDQNSIFYKNTYEIVPNPSGVYGESLPVLFYYCEFYNLDVDIGSENLDLEILLLDSKNTRVMRKSKHVSRRNSAIVEVGTLNISKLPSGSYTFAIALLDSAKKNNTVQSKRVYIYNPTIKDSSLQSLSDNNFLSSEFSVMGEEEIAEIFGVSKYIATKAEIDQWANLTTLESKQKFLFNFWKNRDANQETPENEFKKEYFGRVNYANQKFSTFKKKGWQTDRGRILITYGEPSEIERYPNEVDAKPYELWNYNEIEGGVQFVFADLTGYSDYQLLHSTLRGELRDENWMRKVKTM